MFHRILLISILLVLCITYTESGFEGDKDAEAWCKMSRKAATRINLPQNLSFVGRIVRHNTVCLATFLDKLNLLTSAYCAYQLGTIRDVMAYIGPNVEEKQMIMVTRIVIHPKYKPDFPQHNIAVAKLAMVPSLPFRLACITSECFVFKRKAKDYLFFGAWTSPSVEPEDTKFIKSCMERDDDCSSMVEGHNITTDDTCINSGESLCDANPGGPLILYNSKAKRYEQIGVVSYSKYCKKGPLIVTNTCGHDHYFWIARVTHGKIRPGDVVIDG